MQPYQLTLDELPADELRVHAFHGREEMSKPYSFDVDVTTDDDAPQGFELKGVKLL